MTSQVRMIMALALVALLAGVGPAIAQERVAQLSEVEGTVTIERSADGAVDTARQQGPRVRNGSVFGGDIVATATGGTATLVFTDGSEIKLKPETKLSVREVDFRELMAQGHVEKPAGRVIQVIAGDVWMHIAANPELATEFETPSGVAAVKGTTLSISVEKPKE